MLHVLRAALAYVHSGDDDVAHLGLVVLGPFLRDGGERKEGGGEGCGECASDCFYRIISHLIGRQVAPRG